MESISSRTPEGWPGRCPVCGQDVAVEPADALGDAPCPACGTLVWPIRRAEGVFLLAADELAAEQREKLLSILGRFEDPNADSLEGVEMLMELEETLKIEIPDELSDKWETVDDFLEWWMRGRCE